MLMAKLRFSAIGAIYDGVTLQETDAQSQHQKGRRNSLCVNIQDAYLKSHCKPRHFLHQPEFLMLLPWHRPNL